MPASSATVINSSDYKGKLQAATVNTNKKKWLT